jgi:ligand-binding sensor domain-containing protein
MRKISFPGLILMLAAGVMGFSQLTEAYVTGTWITYTTRNSLLASDDVRAIGMDGLGNMWFGTANGLSKFDGASWKTYTTTDKLAHNMVNAIAYEFGPYGNELWVGTDGGVSVVGVKLDAVTFATPYTTMNTKYPGMISDKILAAAVDSQHVRWFGTDKGLMSFNGNVWKVYTTADKLAHNQVNAIAYEETQYGPEIWVATAGGISVVNTTIDAVTFATPYTTTNSKYPGMISDLIQSATMDVLHNMRWFGTDKGVIGFDGKAFLSYTINDFLPDNDVTSAAVGLDGIVYFGTRHAGVSRFDGVSGASPLDTMWSPIASNTIRAIAVGKYGALWFATDSGVTKWIPEGLSVGDSAENPVAASIRSVFPNPFNPSTTIEFSLARKGRVVLAVYSLSGQKVRELLSSVMSAGLHTSQWDGRDRNGAKVSSGAYIVQLRADNTVVNRKITLIK